MSSQLWIDEIFSSIQGEGFLAGRRQVFIRLSGCNLDCSYCDTPDGTREACRVETKPGSGTFLNIPQPLPLARVIEILTEWTTVLPRTHHSLSLTGGEPLIHADILNSWLPELRCLLPIHLETNGTMYPALEKVIQYFDYISMDMKLPSTAACSDDLWEKHRLFLQVAQKSKVSVKIVVSDDTLSEEIHQVCAIISSVDSDIPLFLQPVSISGNDIGISSSNLLKLQEVASSNLSDVRVIPQMHKLLKLL